MKTKWKQRIRPFISKYSFGLIVCLIIGLIYIYYAQKINNIFIPTNHDYYTYLLDAFLHGQLNVHAQDTFDLSLYHSKWYLYWGPAPVLFIIPFYLISHLQTSDRLYTLVGGIANVFLFYLAMKQFQKYFKISLSLVTETFLVMSFGLASPNFILSLNGNTVCTSQIFATTYLLLFYICYFLFLNKEEHLLFFLLSTIFFYLAVLSRITLVFNGILYCYLLIHYKMINKKIPKKLFLMLISSTIVFACINGIYNYFRFNNFLEFGQKYQQGAGRFDEILKKYKVLSLSYTWHNIYYYFLNIIHFTPDKRPVVIDTEGNSIFSVYPALLLLPLLFYNRKYQNKKILYFLGISTVMIVISISFLMLYFATGWVQFGNRYFFDLIPILFLLLIFILNYIPKSIQLFILAFGIFVNMYGTLAFFGK